MGLVWDGLAGLLGGGQEGETRREAGCECTKETRREAGCECTKEQQHERGGRAGCRRVEDGDEVSKVVVLGVGRIVIGTRACATAVGVVGNHTAVARPV